HSLMDYGTYEFDADGKMILRTGFADDEEGVTYYYLNGKRTYGGLVEMDGDFYYVDGNCKVVKGKTYYITRTNGLIEKSVHAVFDENGKITEFKNK
ncbi:MAG: hypothetical protein K6G72_13650, partial [Lachnospiraceae bacterium]|nr:hypothetical protein [Lachnospiraceae bacterium]